MSLANCRNTTCSVLMWFWKPVWEEKPVPPGTLAVALPGPQTPQGRFHISTSSFTYLCPLEHLSPASLLFLACLVYSEEHLSLELYWFLITLKICVKAISVDRKDKLRAHVYIACVQCWSLVWMGACSLLLHRPPRLMSWPGNHLRVSVVCVCLLFYGNRKHCLPEIDQTEYLLGLAGISLCSTVHSGVIVIGSPGTLCSVHPLSL